MAVTIQPTDLVAALRLGNTAEELAEVTRLLTFATDAVVVHVPHAPDSAHNEAVRRLVGYLFDMPEAARGDAYANAMRNSGAQRMLLPYRRHRAGYADSDAIADAQSAIGTAGNPVVGVRVDGSHLVITFADGSTDTEQLPAGGGGGIDSVARAAATAAQTAADAAQTLATQNEAFKLELPDLVPGVGIALTPSGSRELTISTTGSIVGPEELVGGQWEWLNISIQDPGDIEWQGNALEGEVDTWEFAASGAYFGAQAQLVALQAGDTITITQSATRYQTIEVTAKPTVSSNVVTVSGIFDRFHHSEVPQAFAAVTVTIAPGPLTGVDKVARAAAAAVQDNLDDHEGSTHNTDAVARQSATGAHVLAGQVETDLNLHEFEHPTQGDDAFEWATEGNTDAIPAGKLTLAPSGEGGDDAYEWATEGNLDVIPSGKVNLDSVQSQIDDIHDQLAHAEGTIIEVVGQLGTGNDTLRYTLPVNLNGVYDISAKVTAKVQVNELVNFSGALHITVDGGLGLNVQIPEKTHNYHSNHTGVLNFLQKGVSIALGQSVINFSTEVTGSSPPDVRFIDVENLVITDTSLVNSGNVNPFIADWAEQGNTEQIPGVKLSLGAQAIGAFQQTDIEDIPAGGEQVFEYVATVQKDMDGTLAYVGGGWTRQAAAVSGGGAAGKWYWLSQALGPFTANTAKASTTILQFPIAGWADYAAMRAAVLDGSVTQVIIRVGENDAGDSDDDGANFLIPNVLGFYHGAGSYRAFPAWNVGVDPVKFDVVFGTNNVTVKADIDVGQSELVVVRVGIWA